MTLPCSPPCSCAQLTCPACQTHPATTRPCAGLSTQKPGSCTRSWRRSRAPKRLEVCSAAGGFRGLDTFRATCLQEGILGLPCSHTSLADRLNWATGKKQRVVCQTQQRIPSLADTRSAKTDCPVTVSVRWVTWQTCLEMFALLLHH